MPRDRPRLWDSFKRALGSSTASREAEPDAISGPAGYLPPFLPPDEPAEEVLPAAGAALIPTPVDRNPPAADPSKAEESLSMVAEVADDRPGSPPAPTGSKEASGSPRLARGLASFSRDNADREKKFRHILSDEDGKSRKP